MTDGLHHVGHVVHDLGATAERLEHLGFRVEPPAFPALPPAPGEPPRAVGAGNAHVTFRRNFVELVTLAGEDGSVPANAELVPLRVPEEARPALLAAIESTVRNLADSLARFEGVHILMFDSPDPEAMAERLTSVGVPHGGVHVTRRPVPAGEPESAGLVRYLEIGDPELGPGRVPEGRVGAAVRALPSRPEGEPAHPNGARDLVECVLCVPAEEIDRAERRYADYLGRTPGRDPRPGRVFDLGSDATFRMVTPDELDRLWPGETPPALPGFAGYAVAVADPEATENFLHGQGIAPARTPAGDLLIPSAQADGAAIAFRRGDRRRRHAGTARESQPAWRSRKP